MTVRRILWRSATSLLVAALLTTTVPVSRPAQAADQSLVLEALDQLQAHYVDPVSTVKVLNAAIGGLRTQLSQSGIITVLADIPLDVADADARRTFEGLFVEAATAAAGTQTRTQLAYAAVSAMTDSFNDSHTGFLTPEQNAERRQRQRGQAGFTGVGIVLFPRDGRFFVWTVIPRGPAQAAGVREFDRIAKVNDIPTGGLTVDQVSGMIRGPAGTPVTLTLERAGAPEPLVVTITREPIIVPAIFKADLLDGGVGYIKLYQFVARTGRDVRGALTRLMAQGMRALVLDLRGNSGGFLNELNAVLNALLPSGEPMYTEMLQGGTTRITRTTHVPLVPLSIPIVVLVDEGSASAAELLAAAIQESRRGQVIGRRTAGAVEASIMLDLSDGSALSITSFRLSTGKGVRLEGTGVAPDIAAEITLADLETGQDRPLDLAMRLIRQMALPAGR